jgi:hypothetical protein
VETFGAGDSWIFGTMTSKSLSEDDENRMEAWNGTTGSPFCPGFRAFDGPAATALFSSIKGRNLTRDWMETIRASIVRPKYVGMKDERW